MTPFYLSSSSNDYSMYPSDQQINGSQFLMNPNFQDSSSSNSPTCNLFLNSSPQDQSGFSRKDHLQPLEGDNFGSQAYDDHARGSNNGGLKFSLWKRETNDVNDEAQVRWMSSKMRVMLKMKKSDPEKLKTFTTTREEKLEAQKDHKSVISSKEEATINSINSTTNTNIPIRVCSDCNTTKTPLWRSGPQGPKSLCNACGIRQRKARKAMAAAAMATENGNNVSISQLSTTSSLKVSKNRHKDHKKPNNGHSTKHKKGLYSKLKTTISSPSSSSPTKKNCVEEFLASLSKNLTFHRVFPQDEKEAAILLMALSCGYVHE